MLPLGEGERAFGVGEALGRPGQAPAHHAEPGHRTGVEQPRQLRLGQVLAEQEHAGAGRGGERFWIEDVTIWNLIDDDGSFAGRAALIGRWIRT